MKHFPFLFLILLPFLSNSQEFSYRTIEFDLQSETTLKNFTYKNLRLYPIKAKAALKEQTKQFERYTPLNQALKDKKIRITEKNNRGENAEVNTLYAENLSKDTIYLMAGEVIQGGKQDRVIGQDMLLHPNSGKKKLSVFCVEHGRWTSSGQNKSFDGYFSVSGLSVRKAVEVDKDQSKVWSKVAEANAKNKVTTSTGAYTALSAASDYQKLEKEYYERLYAQLQSSQDVIGVIVITGNKVIGCEIFATEKLFKDASSNLLKSYIHEAVTNGKPVAIAPATVKKYMDDLLVNQIDQERKVNSKGKMFSAQGKKIHLTTYE